MFKAAKVATVVMIMMMGCATDDGELEIDPACEDDAKCDGAAQQGFEIFQGADGKYYFHLVSKNGKIVLRSQAYTTKQAAGRGVESVRVNGVDSANFKVLTASNGEFYVNLYAANHEIIATSETYKRKFNALRAVETSVDLVSAAQRLRAARSGARFQAFVGEDMQSYFHLRGKNGEVMLQSEGYINKASAIKAIASVRENGKIAARYKLSQAADGQWFFKLVAANGETIARGETYASKANAQRAIDTTVALLASQLVADPAGVTAPARSIGDTTQLLQTLGALGDVASTGQSLAYFGAAEQVTRPTGLDCEMGTAAQAAQAYDGLVEQVVTQGDRSARPDLTQAMIDASRTELAQLLGSDSYQICNRALEAEQISGTQTFLLSQASDGPRLVLEIGFEQR